MIKIMKTIEKYKNIISIVGNNKWSDWRIRTMNILKKKVQPLNKISEVTASISH